MVAPSPVPLLPAWRPATFLEGFSGWAMAVVMVIAVKLGRQRGAEDTLRAPTNVEWMLMQVPPHCLQMSPLPLSFPSLAPIRLPLVDPPTPIDLKQQCRPLPMSFSFPESPNSPLRPVPSPLPRLPFPGAPHLLPLSASPCCSSLNPTAAWPAPAQGRHKALASNPELLARQREYDAKFAEKRQARAAQALEDARKKEEAGRKSREERERRYMWVHPFPSPAASPLPHITRLARVAGRRRRRRPQGCGQSRKPKRRPSRSASCLLLSSRSSLPFTSPLTLHSLHSLPRPSSSLLSRPLVFHPSLPHFSYPSPSSPPVALESFVPAAIPRAWTAHDARSTGQRGSNGGGAGGES